MPVTPPPRPFRLLLVEDDIGRVQQFRRWVPHWARLVWAQSPGAALGLIRRDQGHVYGGILLDHDLDQRSVTEEDASLSGTDVALALVQHFSIDIPVLVHSTNQGQVPRVCRQLEDKGFWVMRIPYYDLTEDRFLGWLTEARDLWEYLLGG